MLLNLLFWHLHQDFLQKNQSATAHFGIQQPPQRNNMSTNFHKITNIHVHNFSKKNKHQQKSSSTPPSLLKVLSVNDPYGGVLFGHHRGSTWHQVQQGQLTKATTRRNRLHQFPSLLLEDFPEKILRWNWNCFIFKWGITQINTKKYVELLHGQSHIPIIKLYLYRMSEPLNFQDRIWMLIVICQGRFRMLWLVKNIHEEVSKSLPFTLRIFTGQTWDNMRITSDNRTDPVFHNCTCYIPSMPSHGPSRHWPSWNLWRKFRRCQTGKCRSSLRWGLPRRWSHDLATGRSWVWIRNYIYNCGCFVVILVW